MSEKQKKTAKVESYLQAQGLRRVKSLEDITEGDALAQIAVDQDWDFYIVLANAFYPKGKGEIEGIEGPPEWCLAGNNAGVWVPDKKDAVPKYEIRMSNIHLLKEASLNRSIYYIIDKPESPLGQIAAQLK